ncbi:ribosome maturation factor RimM [Francisellaceae bacterium CB300]
MSKEFVEIARIGATYKLDGELNLYPLASSIETLLSYGSWYIQLPSLEKGSKDWQILKDENVYRRANKTYIKIAGVNDTNIAKKYVNALIGVPKSALPELDGGETYFADIIGCEVINQDNRSFGKVIDIIETGSNEVLVCSDGKNEYLVPYVQLYIVDENIESKKIIVDWEFDYLS